MTDTPGSGTALVAEQSEPAGAEQLHADDPTCGPRSRWTSLPWLWFNAAALAAVLVVLLVLMHPRAITIPDEGLYLAQADALTHGSWSVRSPASDVDPSGELNSLQPDTVLGDRAIPYSRHATYPLLLTPFYWIGAHLGTLVLSVLGTLGAAIGAAFIARRIDERYGLWALWLLGLASPLLFDAYITMAHSLAAAAAAVAFLGVTRAVDDQRRVPLTYAVPALMLAVLLRSEGVVFGLALGLAVGIGALGVRRRQGVDWARFALGCALAVVSAGTYFIDSRIGRLIAGDGQELNVARIATRESANQVLGTWASLFRPFYGGWERAGMSVPLAAAAIVLAALTLRVMPKRTLLPLGFLLGAAAGGVGVLLNPPGLVTGLLPAFPMLVAGLIWLGRDEFALPLVSRALLTTVLTAAGVIATLYEVGGAAEWGGRFFHLLLPVLVPVMILGLDKARRRLTRTEAIVAGLCIAVFTLSMSVSMLRWQLDMRAALRNIVSSTVRYAHDHDDRARPLVLVAGLYADGMPRSFWGSTASTDVLTAFTVGNLANVLGPVKESGRSSVVVLTTVDETVFQAILKDTLDEIGWEVLDSTFTPDNAAALLTVGDPDRAP